ncbi:MAG: HIT domain-containing protein, partial [Firmicutes bacterium]|nr:HIT domain-containing protein [Bacillota bacterium]
MRHQNLWAPWRISYLQGLVGEEAKAETSPGGCFLCEACDGSLDADARRERMILITDERGSLLMNRYPYSNGHLLVAPRQHAADISDLTAEARTGIMEL